MVDLLEQENPGCFDDPRQEPFWTSYMEVRPVGITESRQAPLPQREDAASLPGR